MNKNTIVFVATEDREEAHYLCAVLNSVMADFIARSYSVGKSFGSPHLLQQVAIPVYDPASPLHQRLAELSQMAHELAAQATARGEEGAVSPGVREVRAAYPRPKTLADIEHAINDAVAELWGITPAELEEIQRGLEELG
jgi:hypothetical protein